MPWHRIKNGRAVPEGGPFGPRRYGKAEILHAPNGRQGVVQTQNAGWLEQQLLVGDAFGFGPRQREPEQWQRQRQQ